MYMLLPAVFLYSRMMCICVCVYFLLCAANPGHGDQRGNNARR